MENPTETQFLSKVFSKKKQHPHCINFKFNEKRTYQPKLSKFSTNISSQPTGSDSIEEAENGLQSNIEFTRFSNTPLANTYLQKKIRVCTTNEALHCYHGMNYNLIQKILLKIEDEGKNCAQTQKIF